MAFKMKGFSAFTKTKSGNLLTKVKAKIKNYITEKNLERFEKHRSKKLGKPYVPASKKEKK